MKVMNTYLVINLIDNYRNILYNYVNLRWKLEINEGDKMDVYYNVNLDEKINDIEKIGHLKNKLLNIYLLSNINFNFSKDVKIKKINEITIIDDEILTFALDCDNILKEKNKILRKIKHIKINKYREIQKNCFQVIVSNYNKNNEQHIIDLICSIKVMLLPTPLKKYDYIYDKSCDYLDNEFQCKNICEFENDKCIAKRNFNCTSGCCRHYKSLFSNKLVQCKYLVNKRCTTKCLVCKMFTCSYIVKNKNIKYRFKDIFLVDKFFNPIQKIIILISFFTSKEKIIKRLLMWR